ncbi:MAG: site-specific DNA-methyltransferase [Nitrososphaerota archaeon]|jgi:site-specific DNA-methyltransferase (cytosine-N4-specific)|nr:site-specific DNA-methyltransferase [Nitrososphaerota archaeon]
MPEIDDCSVHLMLTSPPYPMVQMWDAQFCKIDERIAQLWKKLSVLTDDDVVGKIYNLMHKSLAKTWQETFRVLVEGGIAAINIGDATRRLDNKFQLFPNHSRIIEVCEKIGFITLPYILWKKPTTKPHYKGKGAFLGSGFLPPNAYVTLDCEFILLFRKGRLRKFPCNDHVRYESKFTKAQRDEWFSQIWTLNGIRQNESEFERRTAAYPNEIAERLIKMFSIKGDTILDPFLGSGTTMKTANSIQRNCIGYEVEENLLPIIQKNVNKNHNKPQTTMPVEIHIIKRR